jgi:hypothetical protein
VNAIFKGWKGGREGERERQRERRGWLVDAGERSGVFIDLTE